MTPQKKAVFYTAAEVAALGKDDLPQELVSGQHLIYSSPAALAFNSPGAEGFGVKRAGLAVPDSVMLIVSPGCCGRNTSLISRMPAYDHRFFYLTMDSTDIVTGRHLSRIPEAVEEVVKSLAKRPSVVMICITCVDALLGTDMERVCRRAEERIGLPVRPCYMYALTREGRKPPMVHVRQSLYSLLEPAKKRPDAVNVLGFFAPVQQNFELFRYLKGMGVKHIRQISTCQDYAEFQKMAEANFNLVLNSEARYVIRDFADRLEIPSIELKRFYEIGRIRKQYRALGNALGTVFDDEGDYTAAEAAVQAFCAKHPKAAVSVGECFNGDTLETALALVQYGLQVPEVFATITEENYVYLKQLAALSPDTRIYSNLEPTMLYYDSREVTPDLTLGKDAGYYHEGCPNLTWNSDEQPFGYAGVKSLFEEMERVMES